MVLDIENIYGYMQEELVNILKDKYKSLKKE